MAENTKKNKGFGGGAPPAHDPSKGEGPGGFRVDATNVPNEPEAVEAKPSKKAEEAPK